VARIKQLGVRFSASEFVRIAEAAAAFGMTPTAWLRHQGLSALNGKQDPPGRFNVPPAAYPPAKLTRTAGTRFTEEQFEALVAHAIACGLTPTAFIRQVVLGVKLVARRPEIRSLIVAVNRVGNNLNQLVKLANSGVVVTPDLVRAVQEVLVEMQGVRKVLFRVDAGEDLGSGE
jgi:hypothetical protein